MSKLVSLDKDSVGRLFFNFSFPAVTGMIVTALYGIIDGIFIGRGVGDEALAALNIGYPLINFGSAIGLMIGIGGSTLISLHEKNRKIQNRCFSYIITLNIIFYVLLVLFVVIFNEKLFRLMGASEHLLPQVKLYVYPCIFAIGFLMLGNSLNAVVRNDKAPVYAFVAMLIGAVTNIFLDWLFIIVFHWGIFGGAVATAIGQLFSLLFLIRYFFRFGCHLKYRVIKLKLKIILKLLNIGFPSFIMEFAVAFVTILLNISFMKYSGQIGVSAFCIVGYIYYIFRMLFSGFGQGLQPIVSYNYGMKLEDRVNDTLNIAQRVTSIVSVIILILVIFGGSNLVKLFNTNTEVVQKATQGLIFYCSALIFMGINFINIAFLQAKGETKIANILSILRSTVLVAIFLWILPIFFKEKGVWLSLAVSDFITFLIGRFVFKIKFLNRF